MLQLLVKNLLLVVCLSSFLVEGVKNGGLDTAKGDVLELDSSGLDLLSEGNWLVEVYAPWCGFCKQLESVYSGAAKQLKGKINVARIDGDKHKDLAMRFLIQGFPTIFHVLDGGREVRLYEGGRKQEDFVQFVEGGYKLVEPRPFYQNPLNWIGQLLGFSGKIGLYVMELADTIHTTYEIHHGIILVVGIIIATVVSVLFVLAFEALVSVVFGGKPSASSAKKKSEKPSKRVKKDQ